MTDRIKLQTKLLKHNISIVQIFSFLIANLLGGVIILVGIQAYSDFKHFREQEKSLLSEEYAVITKPINTLSTISSLFGLQPLFYTDEIKQLQEHPSVNKTGVFKSANFNIRGSFSLATLNISTDMFLEAVPDEFIDVKFDNPDDWKATTSSSVIPIIIPRKYLNIYNYGYASTKGLPQIGESLTSRFPIKIRVSGNGKAKTYDARIVGFTDRLNTILAPYKFIEEANKVYSDTPEETPSRLILAIKSDRNTEDFLQFLEKNGYRIEGDTNNLKLQTFIHGTLLSVIVIGTTITLLAFILLLVSIQLLIEKNKEKFLNLYSIGYTRKQMAAPYNALIITVDITIWIIAATSVSMLYPQISGFITAISPDVEPTPLGNIWLAAATMATIFATLHLGITSHQLKQTIGIKTR